MSNKVKQIELLDRRSLIILAEKLQIKGFTNKFSSPYRNKDYLKKEILEKIKFINKLRKTKSSNNLAHSENSTNSSNSVHNHNLVNSSQPSYTLRKSKSLNDVSSTSFNTNNLNVEKASCIFPPQQKIVAIGDIHGDLSVAIKALKLANVIDLRIPDTQIDISKINWTGGNTFIVQLGDQIDRVRPSKLFNSLCMETETDLYEDEGSDLKIMCLFDRLNLQAQKVGGAVLCVLGNHELMNVDGDFRYVSPKEFREFGNYFNGKFEYNADKPYGFKERKEVFEPGGIIAKRLANNRYSVVQVGSWIFVHGGISPPCAEEYSLNDINLYIKKWLLGDKTPNTMRHVHNLYHRDDDEHSPFWTRIFSDLDEWQNLNSIKEFNKTLHNLNIKNRNLTDQKIKGMVMGHSPRFMYNKGINSSYNNRIWRVDVGSSRAFGKIENNADCANRLVQVLVINNDNSFAIIKEKCF